MVAPTATTRSTPTGLPLRDGFATMVTFGNDPDISLWEKETTPPGLDQGEMIDTTTFHNVTYRTKWPRNLTEVTNGSFRAAYDPGNRALLMAQIGVNQEITVTYNDGTKDAFWGALIKFQPQAHSDGEQPEADVEFGITNTDSAFGEAGPANTSVAGT